MGGADPTCERVTTTLMPWDEMAMRQTYGPVTVNWSLPVSPLRVTVPV